MKILACFPLFLSNLNHYNYEQVSLNEYNEKEGAEKWVKEHQELVNSWIPKK